MRPGTVCLLWFLATGCGLKIGYNDNPAPQATAQQLGVGTRVRVHTESHGKVAGELARVSADSVVLAGEYEEGTELALPAATVTRVDVSRGRRSRKGRGALIGLLAGVTGGYIALLGACGDDCVGAWILLALPVGGALVGAGIGALIGSQIETERWQRVSWP